MHIAVDVETKELLSVEVTDEKTEDSEVFENLVEALNLEDCLADGAYDTEDIFELLEEKEVGPPGIKIRKDPATSLSPKGRGCQRTPRTRIRRMEREPRLQQKIVSRRGLLRCQTLLQRMVKAASPEGMIQEVKKKSALYNLITRI